MIPKEFLPDLLSHQLIHLLDQSQSYEYRQALGNALQRTTSMFTSPNEYRNSSQPTSQIGVNVSPSRDQNNPLKLNTPEIRKYKKTFWLCSNYRK